VVRSGWSGRDGERVGQAACAALSWHPSQVLREWRAAQKLAAAGDGAAAAESAAAAEGAATASDGATPAAADGAAPAEGAAAAAEPPAEAAAASPSRPPLPEPPRAAPRETSHRDFVAAELRWMARDMAQEKVWRKKAAFYFANLIASAPPRLRPTKHKEEDEEAGTSGRRSGSRPAKYGPSRGRRVERGVQARCCAWRVC